MTALSVVICTFNNSESLDIALQGLGQQVAPDMDWEVLVVDNNSSDQTAEVTARHGRSGLLPGFRTVLEREQGLTHARRRGVIESKGDWIAFVDDDCLLDPEWVSSATAFTAAQPRCGALGGRVELVHEQPVEAWVRSFGWLYAEQDRGADPGRVDFLVGAGLVLRRTALVESGWLQKPLLDDRIGRRLVSGGDMEIGLRIAGCGWELWYEPACRLRHLIPAARTTPGYMRRMAFGLGMSHVMVGALGAASGPGAYTWDALKRTLSALAKAMTQGGGVIIRRKGLRPYLVGAHFALGQAAGVARFMLLPGTSKHELTGAARHRHRPRP